jgi:hypothetical protein
MIFTDDDIFTTTANQDIYRLDTNGNIVWSTSISDPGGAVVAGGFLNEAGDYVTGTQNDAIEAYDFGTGSNLYSTGTDGPTDDSAPTRISGDKAVIGSNAELAVFDPADGSIAERRTDAGHDTSAMLGKDHEYIYTYKSYSGDVHIVKYDLDLNEQWEVDIEFDDASVLGIDQREAVYTVDNSRTGITKISSSGNVQWSESVKYDHAGNVAVDDDADRVYVIEFNDNEMAMEAFDRSGSHIFTVDPGVSGKENGPNFNVPIPTDDDGVLFGLGTSVYKYTADGSLQWSTDLGSGPIVTPPAASANGFVIVGTPNGDLHKVDIDASPRYTLEAANNSVWDYSRYRHNSGTFGSGADADPDPGDRVVMVRDDLAVLGGGGDVNDRAIVLR